MEARPGYKMEKLEIDFSSYSILERFLVVWKAVRGKILVLAEFEVPQER